MILVTGSTGALATLILERLRARGDVIAGTRTPERITGLPARRVDFDEASTLEEGFAGVDVLVMISAGFAEEDVVAARYRAVVAAASAAGVRHVVYTGLTAAADHLSIAVAHRYAERLLRESTMDVTILNNGLYAEVAIPFAARAAGVGEFTAPMGDGRIALVARADLAEVAARIAAEAEADRANAHIGRTYELVGTRPVGAADIAALLSRELNKPVPYRPDGHAAVRESLAAAGLRPFEIGHSISMFANIAAGFLDGTETDLTKLLSGEPRNALDVIAAAITGQGG